MQCTRMELDEERYMVASQACGSCQDEDLPELCLAVNDAVHGVRSDTRFGAVGYRREAVGRYSFS
jgi:hypothetical protein